jgi:hypothetical protein
VLPTEDTARFENLFSERPVCSVGASF